MDRKTIGSAFTSYLLKFILPTIIFIGLYHIAPAQTLTDQQISHLIEKNSFLKGAKIPKDLANRLGASHVAGKYALTKSPYLIEGCQAIKNLGLGVVKLWFQNNPASDYPYNSNWNLKQNASLVDFAKHPYFKEVFDMPFKTFVLSVRGEVNLQQAIKTASTDYQQEQESIYQLAKYLLETYRNKPVVFILQNWEGDWLMRSGTGPEAQWTTTFYPDDIDKRTEVMTNWFAARQTGVERARKEVGKTKCQIYHAIEINKVLDGQKNIPSLVSKVLPHVKTDLVSWSCYDGLENPIDLWRGIDFIKANMKPSGAFPGIPVIIGEIGIPENSGSVFGIPAQQDNINRDALVKRWDEAMAVFIAHKIPYIIHWEVYCNEVKATIKNQASNYSAEQLRGFWLIRPDGSKSYAAQYLEKLLKN